MHGIPALLKIDIEGFRQRWRARPLTCCRLSSPPSSEVAYRHRALRGAPDFGATPRSAKP
jgi:hypothetical protein